MMNDRCGGIFASQVIRLIGNIYSQTMRIYICGERPLSYLNCPLVEVTWVHKKRPQCGKSDR